MSGIDQDIIPIEKDCTNTALQHLEVVNAT